MKKVWLEAGEALPQEEGVGALVGCLLGVEGWDRWLAFQFFLIGVCELQAQYDSCCTALE